MNDAATMVYGFALFAPTGQVIAISPWMNKNIIIFKEIVILINNMNND